MSTGPAFNALGQILAKGGEVSIARRIVNGATPTEARAFAVARFGPLSDDDTQLLLLAAYGAIDGGDSWLSYPVDMVPPSSILYVNPHLFGENWFGKRVLAVIHGETANNAGTFDLWIDLPEMASRHELDQRIDDEIQRWQNTDPDSFARLGLDEAERIIIHRIIAERRY